jgi:hypothetical protein
MNAKEYIDLLQQHGKFLNELSEKIGESWGYASRVKSGRSSGDRVITKLHQLAKDMGLEVPDLHQEEDEEDELQYVKSPNY